MTKSIQTVSKSSPITQVRGRFVTWGTKKGCKRNVVQEVRTEVGGLGEQEV